MQMNDDLIDEECESLEYEDEEEEEALAKSMIQEVVENMLENTFKNDSEEEKGELSTLPSNEGNNEKEGGDNNEKEGGDNNEEEGGDNDEYEENNEEEDVGFELKQTEIESLLDFLENTLENNAKEEKEKEVEPLVTEPLQEAIESKDETVELNIIIDKELLCQLPLQRDIVFEPFEARPLTTMDKIKRWWCDLFPSGTFA